MILQRLFKKLWNTWRAPSIIDCYYDATKEIRIQLTHAELHKLIEQGEVLIEYRDGATLLRTKASIRITINKIKNSISHRI